MVIARAPLRVSFGGGGTDLPAYYKQFGGVVLNVAIDQYIYVMVESSRHGMQISSADQGMDASEAGRAESPIHRLPLLVAEHCAPNQNLRIFIASEVPSGTGLGSSSALTVALVAALEDWAGRKRALAEIAETACAIEIDQLDSPIGKQDQYASALGGMNILTFHRSGAVEAQPVHLPNEVRQTLERRLMLFYTGSRRDAGSILANQRRQSEEGTPRTIDALHAMKGLAIEMHAALLGGDLDQFAQLLHRSWEHKRRVATGISTEYIDHCYEVARNAGALGGKITGAGGGGFLLLYCREELQPRVVDALRPLDLAQREFGFASHGVKVITNDPRLDASHRKPAGDV